MLTEYFELAVLENGNAALTLMMSRSGVQDGLFWVRAGRTWRDRARIGMYWLSPYVLGYRNARPRLVRTSFLENRDIYLRPASNDVRVLRNVFEREDNRLPPGQTGVMETILDLGAYCGLTTLDFANRYPHAEILALEPDAENFRCLDRNVSSADENGRIRIMNACISDQAGHEEMSTTGPHWERSITVRSGAKVPSLTVCDAIDRLGREKIDLLKMDIEGAERLAFKSASQWLPRVRWLLLEVHGEHMSFREVKEALEESGRNTILERSGSPGEWVPVSDETIRTFEEETRRIDLLVPPPGVAGTASSGAIAH